jgi:hypothetical protein
MAKVFRLLAVTAKAQGQPINGPTTGVVELRKGAVAGAFHQPVTQ